MIPEKLEPAGVPEGCKAVITVRGLRNAFGDAVIHDDLNLTVCRGEILGVAGLVGAGRTETLRALFGLDPRDGGTATLGGITTGLGIAYKTRQGAQQQVAAKERAAVTKVGGGTYEL